MQFQLLFFQQIKHRSIGWQKEQQTREDFETTIFVPGVSRRSFGIIKFNGIFSSEIFIPNFQNKGN